MTSFECTFLVTNLLTLISLYMVINNNRKLEKENQELLLETITFSEETMKEIDKLQVALENCRKEKSSKTKSKKDEKKTTSK